MPKILLVKWNKVAVRVKEAVRGLKTGGKRNCCELVLWMKEIMQWLGLQVPGLLESRKKLQIFFKFLHSVLVMPDIYVVWLARVVQIMAQWCYTHMGRVSVCPPCRRPCMELLGAVPSPLLLPCWARSDCTPPFPTVPSLHTYTKEINSCTPHGLLSYLLNNLVWHILYNLKLKVTMGLSNGGCRIWLSSPAACT